MRHRYRYYQIDAFTTEKFRGNPAGVIINATGLEAGQMQQIAREVNNSETAFIFPPAGKEEMLEVRFFTPTREVPICGHATIAAHYAWALQQKCKSSYQICQKTGAGLLPVDVIAENGDYKIVMTQGSIEFGPVLDDAERKELLVAMGLKETDCLQDYPVQIVSTGHSKVMLGITKRARLNALTPSLERLTALSRRIGCNGFYVFTLSPEEEILVHGRMFAPAIGIAEDPVTGNANGPLGAYLVEHKKIFSQEQAISFRAAQGEAIGRAGEMLVKVDVQNGHPSKVQIEGRAVVAFTAEIFL